MNRHEVDIEELKKRGYGQLTVTGPVDPELPYKRYYWSFSCSCGGERVALLRHVLEGRTKACLECVAKANKEKAWLIHKSEKDKIIGRTFGYLKVLAPIESDGSRGMWLCQCRCGAKVPVAYKTMNNLGNNGCEKCKTAVTTRKKGSVDTGYLTDAEKDNLRQWLAFWKDKSRAVQLEMVQQIIADREAEEPRMICHGGTELF